MMKLLRRLDNFLDRNWREFAEFLNRLAGKKPVDDIDWLNMHNNMMEDKDERPNKSKSL